jgi:hypothetical protein
MREMPSRQRLTVAFGRLMHSFEADPANFHYTTRIHPALTSFTDEVCGTLARLIAYVVMLALLAIGGIYFWEQLPDAVAMEPAVRGSWGLASRSAPVFAISKFDSQDKTEAYAIFRHPEGGRKDLFRWTQDEKPIAELEIYRPGGELNQAGPAIAEIAARMDSQGMRELEAAGIIDSKFGTVTLLRLVGGVDTARSCLGFIKRVDDPNFRISGWSCQGDNLAARRAAISCMLNRLVLLTAGNDPKLAELFAHADLRRSDCSLSAAPALSPDWVTGAESPRLRGAF